MSHTKSTASRLVPHPLADIFPLMSADDLAALADDIQTNGLRQPIVLYGDPPRVLDGRNRLAACKLAKVEPRFDEFTGSEDDALGFVLSSNLHRRHLTMAQKAALAVKLLPIEQESARRRMLAGRSNGVDPTQRLVEGRGLGAADVPINGEATQLAGAKIGISKETVRRAKLIADDAPDVFEAMQVGVIRTIGEAQKIAALDEDRRAKVLDVMRKDGVKLKDADATPWYYRAVGSTEWYTPADVLAAARRILGGGFDLDPASCAEANKIVQAERHFDIETDGLKQEWWAERLWLNPPFGTDGPRGGNSRTGVWIDKLVAEFEAGRTKQAVVLVRASPCQRWFEKLWRFPICFVRRRLEFTQGEAAHGQAVAFTAIAGIGVDVERFVEVFRAWGHVVVPGAEDSVGRSVPQLGGADRRRPTPGRPPS